MRRVWGSGNMLADFSEALPKEARAPRRRAAESGRSGLFPHGSSYVWRDAGTVGSKATAHVVDDPIGQNKFEGIRARVWCRYRL